MTQLFKNTFTNPDHMSFVDKNCFVSLDAINRLQYVESQIAYTRQYRSILLRNIKNLDVPTKYTNEDATPVSLKEWILNVPDYDDRPLFVQIHPPINNLIELHIRNCNTAIVHKWERNSTSHILRELEEKHYDNVFIDRNIIENKMSDSVEPWSLSPPPEINFLVPPRNAWNSKIPNTIKDQSSTSTSSRNNNKPNTRSVNSGKSNNKKNDTDTQTNYTSATYTSETTDIISDLQDES
jgi:hypothetical protein